MLGVYVALAHSLDGGAVPDRTTVVSGGQARVVTAQELERRVNQHALERLQDYSLAAIGILFVTSLLVGWVVAGRALAPVDRVTRTARDIGATSLERRIRLGGPDDELRRLADTFDDMLERLDDAFRGQRSFASDASHELRNPIAVVQANADLLLSEPDDPTTVRVRAGRIRAASERLARLGDDLLALARLDEQRPRREVVALDRLAEGLAGELEEPAAEAGVVLAVHGARAARRSTASPCGAPSRTSSRTRCATRRPAAPCGWRVASRAAGPGSPWRTTVRASTRRTARASSTASTASTAPAPGPTAAAASAWPSCARWRAPTAATSACTPSPATARASCCGCRPARARTARPSCRREGWSRRSPAALTHVSGRRPRPLHRCRAVCMGRRLAPVAPRAESSALPPELGAPPLSWVRGAPTRGRSRTQAGLRASNG